MTNTIIERVAKAIYHAKNRNRPWDNLPVEFKRQYFKQARSAIEAMREPTPGMIEAFDVLHKRPYHSSSKYRCSHSMSAMIDAALSEDPSAT